MKAMFLRRVSCLIPVLIFILPALCWSQEKVVKLRYANFFPVGHPNSKVSEDWAKEIEKRTDGRVKISYFPSGMLLSSTQMYDGIVEGIADIGQSLTSYSAGRFPLTEIFTLPLGSTSGHQTVKLMNAFYEKFKPKEFEDSKVMHFFTQAHGVFQMRKAPAALTDLEGLRIKASAETALIVRALNGVPVTMPIGETYDALTKGMLDGIYVPIEALKGFRFAEVVKYVFEADAPGANTVFYVVMNKEKWNSISERDRTIIEMVNEEWIEKFGVLADRIETAGKEFAMEKGVEFIKLSSQQETEVAEKMLPIRDTYLNRMKKLNLPGEEALKFCLDYIKHHP